MTRKRRPASGNGSDYAVGYGKPPREHQFKPGRSGNPKGRPKGAKDEDTIFRGVIGTRVPISLQGRIRHVPLLEAVWMRVANDALKGDAKARTLLLGRSRLLDQTAPDASEPSHDDRQVLRSYMRQVEAELRAKEKP